MLKLSQWVTKLNVWKARILFELDSLKRLVR